MFAADLMKKYNFADCCFSVNFGKEEELYKDFLSAEGHNPCQSIKISDFSDIAATSYGVEYVSGGFERFFRCKMNPTAMMFADGEWKNIKICRGENGEFSEELVITAVYSRLCRENTMLLHASFVDVKGNGIIFAGPSGIGKTTQAQLWEKYRSAEIVNGDKAFLKISDNKVFAYGTPWKGSSPYCLNKKADVKGIVVLRQSKENSLRKLSVTEATGLFLPHVFMPNWDTSATDCLLDTFDRIIKKVPVWLLECRPDREAVEITENAILR